MKKIIAALLAATAFLLSSCSQMATANGKEYNTTVTTLLGFEGITDEKLPGLADELKRFYRLERLGLGNNTLTDISPLSELAGGSKITHLWLFNNKITDISPLEGLTEITLLALNDNEITDISPLTKLDKLTHLNLSGNPISDISPLAEIESLKYLTIFDTLALEEDIEQLRRQLPDCMINTKFMEDLYRENLEMKEDTPQQETVTILGETYDAEALGGYGLTGKGITDEQLAEYAPQMERMAGLKKLFLTNNKITDIAPLKNLSGLTALRLDYNSITDISSLQGLTGLKHLNLSANSIADISVLANLTELDSLTLSQNEITDISPLAGLTDLIYLDLSDNPLTDEDIKQLQKQLPDCDIYF